MKRFTKICLILAAVLTALGMIGVGVGFLLGAKPEQLAGNLSYTAPSLSRSHGQNKDSNSGDSSEYTYDSAIRRLELDVHYASVTIGTSEDDHISVKARNAGKYFKESVEDGDMLVLEDERPKGKATLELEILLPDRVLEEMELDLGAAELTADRLQARQFSLDIGAGAGTIQSLLTSEDASLDIDVGELTIGYFDGSDLELDCGTGQLSITVAGRNRIIIMTWNAASAPLISVVPAIPASLLPTLWTTGRRGLSAQTAVWGQFLSGLPGSSLPAMISRPGIPVLNYNCCVWCFDE